MLHDILTQMPPSGLYSHRKLLPWYTTFRVRISQPFLSVNVFAECLATALGIDGTGQGLRVHSLAPDLHSLGQVATITFDRVPVLLDIGQSGKDEWVFRNLPDGITFVMDTHFQGLTVLYSPNATNHHHMADIISISGIGSNAFGSFKERLGSHMWLQNSLPEDFPNLRVIIYGYRSSLEDTPTSKTIQDYGFDFREALSKSLAGETNPKPLIFITHSLGGILAKAALVQLDNETSALNAALLERVRALLNFGVPNLGMAITSLLDIVEGQINKPFVLSLGPKTEELLSLHERWTNLQQRENWEVYAFYEGTDSPSAKKINGRWRMQGPNVIMVDQSSATAGCPVERTVKLAKGHAELVKFAKNDIDYQEVKKILQTISRNL